MRVLIATIFLGLQIANAGAGTIVREPAACQGPTQRYLVSWYGPWSANSIWLESRARQSGWRYYTGDLADYGCLSSPDLNHYYRIAGCEGINCGPRTGEVFVPAWARCEHNYD